MTTLIKYAVGIDVSKDKLDVCFGQIDIRQQFQATGKREFANSIQGIKQLEQWLKKQQQQKLFLVVAMEATGVYYEKAALYLHQQHFNVAIILPNKARKYIQSLGLKSKNDKIDCTGLCRMAAEQNLELWQPMDDFFYQLRSLTRHHQQLHESKTLFNNQLHAMQHSAMPVKSIVKQQQQLIKLMDKQIEQTLQAIEQHIGSNAAVKQKVENICKIKGVGLITVATVIAETNGFCLFKNIAQVVSYAGYDVVENQSGKHNGKTRISKKGNSHIRRILHMPAFCVVTHQQTPFVDLFNRVEQRTRIKMKAYVAVQKKLLVYIYTLWKNNEVFVSPQKEIVPAFARTTQDEIPCNESQEVLFPLKTKVENIFE